MTEPLGNAVSGIVNHVGVIACASDHRVGTAAAIEGVVASAPRQAIGSRVPRESVVIAGANKPFNSRKGVSTRTASRLARVARERHGHGTARPGIAGGVGTNATVDGIAA